jgi:hypothetical protein
MERLPAFIVASHFRRQVPAKWPLSAELQAGVICKPKQRDAMSSFVLRMKRR